jgi:hypothetical protein
MARTVDAYWRRSYVGLYLRLRQVSHGCFLIERRSEANRPRGLTTPPEA